MRYCWVCLGVLMSLDPTDPLLEGAVIKTTDLLVAAAKKVGTPLGELAEYLPPAASAYFPWMGYAGKVVTPMYIGKTYVYR